MSHASMSENHHPWCQCTINGGQIVGKPIDLLIVGAEGSTELSGTLVRTRDAVAKIRFSVNVNKMSHAIIVRIPHVAKTTRWAAGHPEMVDVAGEISLANHANRLCVLHTRGCVGGSAIVAVSFVIARIDHISANVSIAIFRNAKDLTVSMM